VRQSGRMARPAANVYPPIERPTVSLPPDLAAAKQSIELIRRGEWKDATALAATVKGSGGAEDRRMDTVTPLG
jgi:hypothetical protein